MSFILGGLRSISTGVGSKLPKTRTISTLGKAMKKTDHFHKAQLSGETRSTSSSVKESVAEQRQHLVDLGYPNKYLLNDKETVILNEEQVKLDAFRNALKASERAEKQAK